MTKTKRNKREYLRSHADLAYSQERIARSEDQRAAEIGWGMTRQGLALARDYEYREQLAEHIEADKSRPRHNQRVWRALNNVEKDLDWKVFVLGMSAATGSTIGLDHREKKKTRRDVAKWIGSCLIQNEDKEIVFKVGCWAVNMLIQLPIFSLDSDDVLVMKVTDSIWDSLDDVLYDAAVNHPFLLPFSTPPLPWTQMRSGVVPPDHWAKLRLVTGPYSKSAVSDAIDNGEMQMVLDAINSLQNVAFTINKPVMKIALKLVPQIPESPDKCLPVPEQIKQKHLRKSAKDKARNYNSDMVMAEMIAEWERFYIPLKMDWRGRIYAIPHFSFQLSDHVRGLFRFADGEPIGPDGLFWLKAHVAALSDGLDAEIKPSKMTFSDRAAWTDRNLDRIRSIAETALSGVVPGPEQLPKKDQIQFVGAVIELKQAIDEGPGFITRLPISFDGSCSGLQHLCAMTRAPEGSLANLTANDWAQDFYGKVAAAVYERNRDVMRDADDREIVKQSVMTFFFGSEKGGWKKLKNGKYEPVGMTAQIIDVLNDRGQSTTGAKELARDIYDTICEMVPAAVEVRKFLVALVKLLAAEGKPLRWRTPLGFPVINEYHKPDTKTIAEKIEIPGQRSRRFDVKLVIGDKPGIYKEKAANSVAANYVHSFDATHLHMIAFVAKAYGIKMVAVHDSFACLAPRAKHFYHIIRERFIALHGLSFLFREILESAAHDLPPGTKLPAPPRRHTDWLDLLQVLQSDHAFS